MIVPGSKFVLSALIVGGIGFAIVHSVVAQGHDTDNPATQPVRVAKAVESRSKGVDMRWPLPMLPPSI